VLLQIVAYAVVEKGMRTKENKGRAMMQALELLWLVKLVNVSGQSDVEQ